MLWGRRRGDGTIVAVANRWSAPMPQPNDLSRSLVALDQDSTIIAVVEMSQSSWLVAGMLTGIEPTAQEAGAECRKAAWPAASLARRGGQGWPQDHPDCTGLRSWSRRLLVGALAEGARGGGACDPSLECRRIAGTSSGEDRPTRHRVTEAGVLGVAAWGTGPLHHGAGANECRRGRQAAQSGARVPGQGTRAHRQPNEGDPRPAGHSQLQTNPAQGGGASCNTAHAGGLDAAAECLGRVAAQYGAPGLRRQPDQGDRGGSSGTIGAGARDRATRHGTAPGSGRRRRRRNG